LLGRRRKLIKFVRVKFSSLQAYLIASGFHSRLSGLYSALQFFKLDDLVAMLCLQCAVNQL